MGRIEEELFDKPSGSVRGTVVALALVKGKEKRVAHATLLTTGEPEVVLEVPHKLAVAEIAGLTSLLNDFANRVATLDAELNAARPL